MDSKQKQRAVIEFLTKEGCSLCNIHRRLQNVYGDVAIDRSNMHRWMRKFKEGVTSIEHKPRSGRPSTATTDTNRQRVDELIRAERRVTLRELATQLDCGHNAVKKWVQQYTPEFFKKGFKSWVRRWRKCIACDGDYVQ
jgi:transposase